MEIRNLTSDYNYFNKEISTSDKVKKNNSFRNYSIKSNGLERDTFDYSKDDGKISFKDKAKNFLKGIISPITTMFSSPKNLIIGAGAIAAGGLLLVATGGALAPVLVAGGIIGGGLQLGIGIYKASSAKTDDEAKDAWQNIGAGTSSVLMSSAGAKSALKASGANTEGMSFFKSVLECFKQTPKLIKNSFHSFTSGSALTNIKNLFKFKSKRNDIKQIQSSEETQKPIINSAEDQVRGGANKDFIYDDDGIMGYDASGSSLRDEMRERILSQSSLSDEHLVVQSLDDSQIPQLNAGSRYYELGEPKLNNKTNKYIHLFENLKDMPDGDGLRGKTPLSGKKGLKFKLTKMKNAGIKRVIDLRANGECSSAARTALADSGLEYINFPVEDGNWSVESLSSITKYINAIKSGDYYVGCANGQARTDLAVAINYILNPQAKNVPQLYYGTASSSRVSVKSNIIQILDLIKENPKVVSDWGWNNYEQFSLESGKKLQTLLNCLSNK